MYVLQNMYLLQNVAISFSLLDYCICYQEKDRDGCPKIVNLGSSKTDLFYEMKKYGFKKR